ncbi:MAG: c-type cytochrome [Actinomycetota bacterium]|nr:c-type cytochrome [Actinomycetota bacterium]MDK1016672.1 c-type cytochrome [Actinomycetota bacterium]MDK1027050.1 c-type cytochrome [Actinomycetota bacterium]MDK1038618.1 c-type cytochrome [Actinomycetota bacterium]MDK1096527.1 c-type cytochrome [Actinomycetota bacterium]
MKMKHMIVLVALLALTLAACGGGGADGGDTATTAPPATGAGDPIAGADVYQGTCSACHNPDLAGIDGLGLPLAPSEFVASMSEQDLADFIAKGRLIDDPANTVGIDMPQRGGNPSLSDQALLDVAAYIKAQN